MAIELWEGTPGSGKTSCCTVDVIDFLTEGGVVFSNFDLVEGWADIIASKNLKVRLGLRDRAEYARQLYQRWRTIGDVDSVRAAAALVPELVTGRIARKFEGQALIILDEVQLVFNSRTWQGNMDWIEFFTQHRKYKLDIRLIAHDIEMVDSQIRPLVEYRVSCRNLAKVRVPVIGVPMSWFYGGGSVFMAIWRYAGKGAGSGLKVKSQTMRLCKWAYGLFDSHRIFSRDQEQSHDVKFMGSIPTSSKRCGKPINLESFFADVQAMIKQ